jgi:hypothetical protein
VAPSNYPNEETVMKYLGILCALALIATPPAFATGEFESSNTRMLAGRWMFATDVGHQIRFPGGGHITAIGVFRFDRQGTLLDGVFDATAENFRLLPGITFTGSVVVNANCTGTLTFVTSGGVTRTDSIVVLGPGFVRGMSQDPDNLWTYEMRRL